MAMFFYQVFIDDHAVADIALVSGAATDLRQQKRGARRGSRIIKETLVFIRQLGMDKPLTVPGAGGQSIAIAGKASTGIGRLVKMLGCLRRGTQHFPHQVGIKHKDGRYTVTQRIKRIDTRS